MTQVSAAGSSGGRTFRLKAEVSGGTLTPGVVKGQNMFKASICHVMNQDLFVASYFYEWRTASCVFP